MADRLGAPWIDVAWVVASTAAFYVTTFAAVRIAGRRTLAQLSAFDVLVSIALGSLLATVAVSEQQTYGRGVAALLTLLVLQVLIAWARRRSRLLRRVLEFPPERVIDGGGMQLPTSPMKAQLTEDEVLSALRQKGIFDLGDVSIVILEPTGQFSVHRRGPARA